MVFPKELGPEDVGVFLPIFFIRIDANAGISSSSLSSSPPNTDDTGNFLVTSGFLIAELWDAEPSFSFMPALVRGVIFVCKVSLTGSLLSLGLSSPSSGTSLIR